jgi:pimeloyl-ACP methyl ester carboxylesterase
MHALATSMTLSDDISKEGVMNITTGTTVTSGILRANGAELYHEIRGTGPALLFISGAFGDAGYWTAAAGQLADRCTVVTYDRRGNSRSPLPHGTTKTSMAEQADDAAALITRLGLAPAIVLGSSGGATILLELLTRHPDVVRLALVHEPPLLTLLPNGAEVGAEGQAMVEQGFARGGPRAAAELFIRANAGDQTFENLESAMRARLLDNAETFFSREVNAFGSYQPDVRALRTSAVPIIALAGVENRGVYYGDAARAIAENTGSSFVEVPGAHVPYMTCPDAFVKALRALLPTT